MWLPLAGMPVLQAVAIEATTRQDGDNSDDVTTWHGLDQVLIEQDGRQHVVLRDRGIVVQLDIKGADVMAGPVNLSFHTDGSKAARRNGLQLTMLNRIITSRRPKPAPLPDWTSQSLKLRNAIIALDGRAARASLREIAVVIHGQALVDRDWRTGGLKDRVRRYLRRGIKLSETGFRDLLRQGW